MACREGAGMMTESEAHEKWCPFTRSYAHVTDGSGVAVNRAYPDDKLNIDRACCIASACMAWRSFKEIKTAALSQSYDVRQLKHDGWDIEESTYSVSASRTVGYCGLAGKP